jgi:hypothetical protein
MPRESMTRARAARLATVLLLGIPGGLMAQAAAAPRTAAVTYLSGASVYIGAGRDQGLTESHELTVFRGDSTIATLKVAFLSSRQAACTVVSAVREVALGDSVRFVPVATPAQPALAEGRPGEASGSRAGRSGLRAGLRGRVGVRYLVANEDPGGVGFRQPSADLRLQGSELGGTPLGLALDLRARRTTRDRSSGAAVVDGRTRVYQAALLWHRPGDPFRLVLGRQYLAAVTSVSLFDGLLTEVNGRRLSAGVFAGVEPEPAELGFSSEVRNVGGYLQLHGTPAGPSRWQVTTGVVGSYRGGRANREFLFGQAGVSTRTLSLYALQEIDRYNAWKQAQGEDALTPTSTYLSGTVRAAGWLSFRGSYDTRRRVRLYRDAIDPATAFDDSYRKGASAGVTIGARRVRLSGDLHRSTSKTAGTATAYTGTLAVDQVTPLQIGLALRVTRYDNAATAGHLETMRVSLTPTAALRLDGTLGRRTETDPLADPTRRRIIWYGMDADLGIGRSWYLSLSVQREQGAGLTSSIAHTSLTWRF